MAWLTSLLKKPDDTEAPEADAQAEATETAAAAVAVRAPTGPPLAVLEPDIAGISSFKLNLYHDSADAAEHLLAMRPEVRRGSHVFWALQEEPIAAEQGQVESLVLIRADSESDLVYVVSFLDVESALSFTRFEVRRGLNLHNVMIYWAAWAQVREELDGVTVMPPRPPRTARHETPVTADSLAPAEVPTEPIVPETPIEAEALAAVQRYLDTHTAEPDPADLPPAADASATALEGGPPVDEIAAPVTVETAEDTAAEDALGAATAEPIAMPAIDEPAPAVEPLADEQAASLAGEPEYEPEGWPPPMPARTGASVPEGDSGADGPPLAETDILQSVIPEEEAALDEAVVFQHRVMPEGPTEQEPDLSDVEPPEFLRQPHLSVHGDDLPVVEEIADPPMLDAVADGLLITEADEEEAISGPVRTLAGDEEIENLAPTVAPAEVELPLVASTDPAPEPVQSYPGDEEATSDMPAAVENALPDLPATDGAAVAADDASAPGNLDEFDVAYEVERLLNRRRFDRKDSPFSGFESPPGRF